MLLSIAFHHRFSSRWLRCRLQPLAMVRASHQRYLYFFIFFKKKNPARRVPILPCDCMRTSYPGVPFQWCCHCHPVIKIISMVGRQKLDPSPTAWQWQDWIFNKIFQLGTRQDTIYECCNIAGTASRHAPRFLSVRMSFWTGTLARKTNWFRVLLLQQHELWL